MFEAYRLVAVRIRGSRDSRLSIDARCDASPTARSWLGYGGDSGLRDPDLGIPIRDSRLGIGIRSHASTIIAVPMPPPMHSDAAPRPPPRACSAWTSVVSTRAPLAPIGWPSAIAPPCTFTLAGSSFSSRTTASDCAANASFSSIRSRSPTRHLGAFQRLAHRLDRPHAHDHRIHAGRAVREDPRERLASELAAPSFPSRSRALRRRR